MKFNTSLLHGAFRGEPQTGATLTPIYQSSAFEQESAERLEKIFHNQAPGFSYTRINNPTVEAFEKRMTVLEGGKSSVACASGMAVSGRTGRRCRRRFVQPHRGIARRFRFRWRSRRLRAESPGGI